MFGWLKRTANRKIIQAQEADLIEFIKRLKGMDDESIGTLIVAAAYTRRNLELNGQIPNHLLKAGPVMDTLSCHSTVIILGKAIKQHQANGNNSLASLLLVWAHSIRALGALELRPLGKLLWTELIRGIPYIEEGVESCPIIFGFEVDERTKEDARFIPVGLEPD